MRSPTLRQLEYVVAVADHGQFVDAATACAVSQPALSKQVKEVEEMLGVQLFERRRPRVIVTAAGEEVVRRARELLLGARDLVEAARQHSTEFRDTLRLGVIPTVAPYGLPGFIARFRARYPDARIIIEELQTHRLLDALRDGSVDLGLLALPFDQSGLETQVLVTEPFALVAPRGAPLARGGAVGATEITGAKMLLVEDGHCLRDQAIEVCAAAGAIAETSVKAASVATLVRLVESGLGSTLLPASAIASEIRGDANLVVRSFEVDSPARRLALTWRDSSPSAERYQEIAGALRDHLVQIPIPDWVEGPCPRITRM